MSVRDPIITSLLLALLVSPCFSVPSNSVDRTVVIYTPAPPSSAEIDDLSARVDPETSLVAVGQDSTLSRRVGGQTVTTKEEVEELARTACRNVVPNQQEVRDIIDTVWDEVNLRASRGEESTTATVSALIQEEIDDLLRAQRREERRQEIRETTTRAGKGFLQVAGVVIFFVAIIGLCLLIAAAGTAGGGA